MPVHGLDIQAQDSEPFILGFVCNEGRGGRSLMENYTFFFVEIPCIKKNL